MKQFGKIGKLFFEQPTSVWVSFGLLTAGIPDSFGTSHPNGIVPVTQVSPSSLPSEDLALPAFDVLITTGEPPYRVGDLLSFRVTGTENDKRFSAHWQIKDDGMSTGAGTDLPLHEQGWDIQSESPLLPQASQTPSSEQEGAPIDPFHFRAVPIKSGKLILPSLLMVDDQGNKIGRTNPFEIEVQSAISSQDPKPTEPEAIEPPVGLEFPLWVGILGLMAFLALVGGLSIGIYRWRKRKIGLKPKQTGPALPEDELALSAIALLESKTLLSEGRYKEFYFELSEILKTYLGSRYQINALESTTCELMDLLKRHPLLSQESYEQIYVIGDALDLVKFTDHVPEGSVTNDLTSKIKDWIRRTKLVSSYFKRILGEGCICALALGLFYFCYSSFLFFTVFGCRETSRLGFVFSLPIPEIVSVKSPVRILLLFKILSFIFLVVALARPQKSYHHGERTVSGIDIVMLLDVSASMNIEDLAERSRIDVAKDTMENFVRGRQNDRIGFVMFSGEPLTLSPPTLDYGLLLQSLHQASIGILKDGTAIGDGLAVAVNHLRASQAKSRVVILLTDGDNNLGQVDPATAGELAAGYGIRVYTIAIGREGRVKMPIRHKGIFGNTMTSYQWFENALNPELLQKIAALTHGKFYRVNDESALASVFQEIDQLERTDVKVKEKIKYDEAFELPLKFGMLGLILSEFLERFWWRLVL